MSGCKTRKALSHMSKQELIDELTEQQAEIDPKWTVPELRAVLKEYRALDPTLVRGDPRLKGLSKMTLNVLRSRCEEHHIDYTMKDQRGKLMILLRRHCQNNPVGRMAPRDLIMNFGRHKGKTYQQVLTEAPQYADWAMAEVKAHGEDCGEDLRNFVAWLTGAHEAPIPTKEEEEPPREAKAGAPASAGTTASKGSSSSNLGATPKAAAVAKGSTPTPPPAVKASTPAPLPLPKRTSECPAEVGDKMDSQCDPAALEEAARLHARLREIASAQQVKVGDLKNEAADSMAAKERSLQEK